MKLSEFEPGMVIKHVPGRENILADILSRRADYAPVGKIVPWSTPVENAWHEADTLVLDCFEALSWGRPVRGASCPHCAALLPPMQLSHPSRLDKERTHTCTACGGKLRWTGLISPLGRFEPVVQKEGTATGLFLTVSGQPPARGVSSQLDAGTSPG